jgi:hypothetical protein
VRREPDRRPALLHRRRQVRRVLEDALQVGALGTAEHRAHRPERGAGGLDALGRAGEGDAVGAVLGAVRPAPQAERDPPARDHVEHRGHLRRQRRRPVAGREHRDAQARPRRERRQRGEPGERVEGLLVLAPAGRLQVVVQPDPVEPELLGAHGGVAQLVPGGAVLGQPHPHPRRHAAHPGPSTRATWASAGTASVSSPLAGSGSAPPAAPASPASRSAAASAPSR